VAERRCRACGCTWNNACPGGCYWVEPDLCSECVDADHSARSSAILSACGFYRYRLERAWSSEGGVVCFIGVNPSTADATIDDQTVRKWRGFAARWGFGSMVISNLFAYRATAVTELAIAADPKGPENDRHLGEALKEADLVVPCWGSRSKLPPRLRARIETVRQLLRTCGRPVRVLGLTASGDPQHPLMIGYDRQLQDWAP
jgi:hypothetical protein